MARRGKTVIGGGEGRQSERMMRAAESGAAARQRASSQYLQQQGAGQQQAMQQAQTYGGLYQRDAAQAQQAEQFSQEMDLRRSGMELEAAKAGFEPAPTREEKLAQDMAQGEAETRGVGALPADQQQNLADQAQKPVELDGRRWVPGEERKQETQFRREQQAYRAQTERIRAEAYRAQVAASHEKARLTGDKEEQKKLRGQLMEPVKSNVKRFERFMNGKYSDEDWAAVEKMAAGFDEPSLQQAIQARDWNPRVQQFMNAMISKDALKFISATGELPDGELVDLSSPKMQEFTQAANMAAEAMRMLGPEWAQYRGINTMADKTRYINETAAGFVLSGMTSAPQAQEQGLFGGAPPSPGMQPPPAPGGAAPQVGPGTVGGLPESTAPREHPGRYSGQMATSAYAPRPDYPGGGIAVPGR